MRKGKTIKLSILIILALFQTGCKILFLGRTEINKIEFIRVIGIDKSSEQEGYVRLTVATQRIQASTSGMGEEKESSIIVSEGQTVFEAVRNFWNTMDRRPFWGHVEYALIGEEAAKDGLMNYIDFFCRDPEVRLNLKVFLVKGRQAEEIITEATGEKRFIFEQLNGISENKSGQSIINEVDLVEVMYILDKEYLSLYIPCLELQQKTKPSATNSEMDVVMNGFALFDGDKLAAHLDADMGRGLNWLRNNIESGIIVVESPKGNMVSMEIIESNTKLKPVLSDQKLTIHVNVFLTCNIGGIKGYEDVVSKDAIAFLEKQLQQTVKSEIEAVIDFSQRNNLDILSAGEAVFHKYPIQWEDKFEKEWKTAFSETVFKVNVTPVITGTYNILQPSKARKE
jgi:spore germination protein KC